MKLDNVEEFVQYNKDGTLIQESEEKGYTYK
jgi:hypothetical protein